jgi:hypothetical protein
VTIYTPTEAELREALREAVEWSNWFFDAQDFRMAEQWHLVAVELQAELDLRSRPQ